VAGYRCDRCDRGTTGSLPYCVPCGECFDNWDTIIGELKEETDRLVTEGRNIKVSGAPGAFGKEFKEMEDKLDEVRRIIAGSNVTAEDLDSLREKLNQIRKNITDSGNDLDTVENDMADTTNRIEAANNRIDSIKLGLMISNRQRNIYDLMQQISGNLMLQALTTARKKVKGDQLPHKKKWTGQTTLSGNQNTLVDRWMT
jgi:chromosome segregation ATPase